MEAATGKTGICLHARFKAATRAQMLYFLYFFIRKNTLQLFFYICK